MNSKQLCASTFRFFSMVGDPYRSCLRGGEHIDEVVKQAVVERVIESGERFVEQQQFRRPNE